MPKAKSRKTIIKKIKVTKNGKVMRGRASTAHLRSKKNASTRGRGKQTKITSVTSAPWNNIIGKIT